MPIDRLGALGDPQEEDSSCLLPDIAPIHAQLELLRSNTSKLEDLQLSFLSDNDKRTQSKIEKTMDAINKNGIVAKEMIVQFDRVTDEFPNREENISIIEMRRNQFRLFARKLVEVTKGAWDLQQDYEKQRVRQVSKRLRVRFTDNEGDFTMTTNEADEIAQRLVSTGNEDQLFLLARDELAKAMERRDEVVEIERSTRELYQMFCDLNVLVIEEGSAVDVVEKNVNDANNYLEKGNLNLAKAKKAQKSCIVS
eukprot:Tbor_TRINITY_DN4889_c1_g1::TRINITY_DN4889_c1_g1_i3::g.1339::m.1339